MLLWVALCASITWEPACQPHLVQLPVSGRQLLPQQRHVTRPAFNVQEAPAYPPFNPSRLILGRIPVSADAGPSAGFPACRQTRHPAGVRSIDRVKAYVQTGLEAACAQGRAAPVLEAAALLALPSQPALRVQQLLLQQRHRLPCARPPSRRSPSPAHAPGRHASVRLNLSQPLQACRNG